MVRVKLGGPLMSQAGVLDRGVTVAVDGTIYRGAFLAPIPEGSEVYLLPALVGG
jgi:sulfur-carrier protein